MRFSTTTISTLMAMGAFILPTLAAPAPSSTELGPQATETAAVFSDDNGANDTQILAASSRGHVSLVNQCPFDLVFQRCYQAHGGHPAGCDPSQTGVYHLKANGGTYHQEYTGVVGDGIAFKVRHSNGDFEDNILQLEYTYAIYQGTTTPYVSYDVSEVNVNPFGSYGFTLTTSDPKCFRKDCKPPATSSPGVFTQPQNGIPHDCGIHADIGLVICSDKHN